MGICGSVIKDGLDFSYDVATETVNSQAMRDLPRKLFIPLSILLMACMLAVFLLILIRGYYSQMKLHYLAPSIDADSELCDDVVISHTGVYLLSSDGYWEGDDSFSYSNAKYVSRFKNARMSVAEYEAYIDTRQSLMIDSLSSMSTQNDLALNLLYWMSYVLVDSGSQTDRFYMNADPSIIFDRELTAGGLTNQYYDCRDEASTSYDRANSLLKVTFDIESFNAGACKNITHALHLGYAENVSPTDFKISVDVRSLITAVAVNRNVMSVSDLQMIEDSSQVTPVNNETYVFARYVDPRYPGMRSIYCSSNTTFSFCFLVFGNTLAIPLFSHRGSSAREPIMCDCAGEAGLYANDSSYDCNKFTFLSGALFYYVDLDENVVPPLFTLLNRYDMATIHEYALGPMFAGSAHTASRWFVDPAYFTNQTRRDNWYEFCDVEGYGSCSFLVFTSYDTNFAVNQQVSPSGNEVTRGACYDSFSTTDEAWARAKETPFSPLTEEARAKETPFSPLTEEYEVCSNDKLQAVVDNLGIASGDVSLAMPIGIVVIVALMYLVQYVTGKRYMKRHSESARSEILDQLATAILNEKLLVDPSENAQEADAPTDIPARSTSPNGKPVLVLNQSEAAVREIKQKFDQSVAAIENTVPAMLDYLDGIFLTLMQVHSLHSPKDDDDAAPAGAAADDATAAAAKKAKLARKARRPYLDDPLYLNVLEMLTQLQSGPWAIVGDKALCRRCSAAQLAVLKPLWMKLVAVLMVHSAILLQCDMSVVMQKHGDRVQYQLGRDFWTLNELQDAAC
eukprot:gene4000-2851_t